MCFQSAFHRGMECYVASAHTPTWSFAFSPLFIAVWNVTRQARAERPAANVFQSAFHRGMECYYNGNPSESTSNEHFQSAFHRGMECYEGGA